MPKITKKKVQIAEITELSRGIYDMYLDFEEAAEIAIPGQFVSLYCKDGSRLLPRPISICGIDKDKKLLRLVFRVAGEGTQELANYTSGDWLEVMGPLGNGFCPEHGSAIVIGGGIGIPPMLALAKELDSSQRIVLGYRNDLFLKEEFEKYGTVYVSTEDGSYGTKGTVIDALVEHNIQADIIYACGPVPMLRAVKEYAAIHGIKAKLSLEEHMACGIGACLACVCKTKEIDAHTNVRNKRICKEGPVFFAEEVDL